MKIHPACHVDDLAVGTLISMIYHLTWLLALATLQPNPTPSAVQSSSQTASASVQDDTKVDTKWPTAQGVPGANVDMKDTALSKYVFAEDNAYAWELVRETPMDGITMYDIRLTSQRWRNSQEVNHPLWTHWLTIGVPATLKSQTPIMIIGGGSRRDKPQETPRQEFLLLARSSGTVVCAIDNVPNQPLQFEGDGVDRREDDLLSQSWNLAMRDDDALWIGRFAMVKSVKRAMDATETFLSSRPLPAKFDGQELTKGFMPKGFFVTGASKRGWTTWLIAAVDSRVKAIAPIVIDMLNMAAHTPHHFASYGFWSPALDDYIRNGIAAKFGSPELATVIAHEDPAAYLEAVKGIPKYIITASGDEFFPTDSAKHYEHLLTGEWHLRTVPNAGHGLKGSNVPFEILAFYQAFASDKPRPQMSWTQPTDGRVQVTTSEKPTRVLMWTCENPKARDFRIGETGTSWVSKEVQPTDETGLKYDAKVDAPGAGWKATLIECTFAPRTPGGIGMVFTTRVFVTPDTLPFKLGANPQLPVKP
jgi:PhoPQ-activated pathogenicity-related protein